MPRAVDSCLVEAARLRRSGAEWDASFEEAGVEDTSPAKAVYLSHHWRDQERGHGRGQGGGQGRGNQGQGRRQMEQHDSLRGQVRAGAVVGQMRHSGAAAAPL